MGKGDNRQARPVVTDLSAVQISGAYWNSQSYAEIGDLIGEGPIEGIVSGDYSHRASENKTGYNSVTFNAYTATGSAGGDPLPELGFLRSVYWNDVPVVDKHGYFNFQDINVEHNFGDPIGNIPTLSASLGNGADFDLSVERGIGERLFGPQVKGYDKATEKDYAPGRQGSPNSQPAVLEGAIDRYSKTYTIYNKECSNIQVSIKVNALFEQVLAGPKLYEKPRELKPCNNADVGYGDTKARTIAYNIYYLPLFDERFNPAREDADQKDGAFTDSWVLANGRTEKIVGKIETPYIRTTDINVNSSFKDMPGFQGFKIRIVRLTPESLTSFLSNRSFVHSLVEVYGTRLRYPYTAMVYSRFDARNFQSIPSRSYDTKLLKVKVPSNYNPVCKTYGNSDATDDTTGQKTGARYNAGQAKWTAEPTINNGIFWDGEFKKDASGGFVREWTDNPAWCFYDLITNPRYGLGEHVKDSDVDKWSLYEIAQYCDGMVPDGFGSYEPRFSMNYIITSREEAFKVLNDLSSMFRGITYYAHGSIFAVQDKYKDPVFQFNNSNVTQGDFTYSSSAKKARHSVAIIRYNDKRDNFQPAVEYMEDEESVRKYGILELQTTALGCTSKGQARRFGKWILASESEETETVQFSIGHEGGLIRPGDVVQIYDNFRSPLKRSGRTNAVIPTSTTTYFGAGADTVTGNSIILDSAMEFTSDKQYNLSLLTPTFSYVSTQIAGLNSSGINEISRSQIQNLVFSGAHARVITGSYKSEYYEGGSGICTQIYFSTGLAFGGQSNQLDFDNYVITGYTNTGVNTDYGPTSLSNTVADYSGGCFSGENLIWSVEPSDSEDSEFVSGNFSNFRIINIKEADANNYSVSALAYSTGKYDAVDSSVKVQDLTYYDTPQFPTGETSFLSAALLEYNTSLFLEADSPYQKNVEQNLYQSIKIEFNKAGYNRDENINYAGKGSDSKVVINDELTYFVSITTTGNPNQHTYATGNSPNFLYTVPTADYKNIYKANTNLIITPEDTLYTDAFTEGKITAEILVTEKKDYYVTVFAANGAGRLSQGLQRVFSEANIKDNSFFTAINHTTISNLTSQGITDTSTPENGKVQEDLDAGEPGFVWTPGFESALRNAPVNNQEGPKVDGIPGAIPTYPLQMFENNVDWRVTFRAPSREGSPNIPSNTIYLEFTGYQSDVAWPSFVLTTDYNNPALIDDLRSRTLVAGGEITGYKNDGGGITYTNDAEVGYYLVDPSGMIVKNDLHALPLRTFDIVVEAHDKEGRTSQNNYVWANTIYNSDVQKTKGTETYEPNSVNSKYDIFGANIPTPSGVVFAPNSDTTSNMTVLLGGGNNSFISPAEAYEKNYPYVASAMLLADGTFFIGITPAESEEGLQRATQSELDQTFSDVRGMVFYYTVGTALKTATRFTVDTSKILSYDQESNNSVSADEKAFGGIVQIPSDDVTVYRGFYLLGENDSLSRISLRIPQIGNNNENVMFCAALFDTLSLSRAFTRETLTARTNTNGMPLIFSDRTVKFNYSSDGAESYEVQNPNAGNQSQLPESFKPNSPIEVQVFSMISQTQQCMSNQVWGQINFSLDNVTALKEVLGYEPPGSGTTKPVKKDAKNYRFQTAGGAAVNSARLGATEAARGNFPLDLVDMYKGHNYTLPMMLGNAYVRGYLDATVSSDVNYWERDISSTPWFIMGFGDPRMDEENGLKGGTVSNEYYDLLKKRNTPGTPTPFQKTTRVVDLDSQGLMITLLDRITAHEPMDISPNVLPISSAQTTAKMYNNPAPIWQDAQSETPLATSTVDLSTQKLALDFGGDYNGLGFYPFSRLDWVSGYVTEENQKAVAPITRTTYEFPISSNTILENSVFQGVFDRIHCIFKVFEIKIPDLPFMAINPGGARSPTGWRVRHFAYLEFTVYGNFGDPKKYIVHPLEGYRAGEKEEKDDPNSDLYKYVTYDSIQDFGETTRTKNSKPLWRAEEGGLLPYPPSEGPRLTRKAEKSFTFVMGAPANWTPQSNDGLELSNWFGADAVLNGVLENSGFNLINFAVLKSN